MLVVVIDDVGIDQYAPWDVVADPVPAPTMDCLCETGLRFQTVYASPFCSPARAGLLTGRHPRREGIGRFVDVSSSEWELPLARRTLAEALGEEGYATAFYGKWHLATERSPSFGDHPGLQGFAHFSGTLANLAPSPVEGEGRGDYFAWRHLEDGTFSPREGYVTSATVDDALQGVATLPEPWFVVVSFHGAHEPLHAPPRELLRRRVDDDADDATRYRAMVEAVDTELGRLLRDLDAPVLARTQVWTISDNGTAEAGVAPELPRNRRKGTLFEAGTRVPMVVSGAGVEERGAVSEALVSILDVFPTVVAQAGGDVGDLDGMSLLPLFEDPTAEHHDVLYADVTTQRGPVARAVRNRDTKVVVDGEGDVAWWRVGNGLDEEPLAEGDPALLVALDEFVSAYEAEPPDVVVP